MIIITLLQDLEMPIRNHTCHILRFLFVDDINDNKNDSIILIDNYCLQYVFRYLQKYLISSSFLIRKLFDFFIHPSM